MAQGTRGRWLRVAATGFGVVLCTGLVGCMNSDKPKDTKVGTKQPTQGLPGTPTLPGGANGAAMNKTPGGTGAYGGTAIGAGSTFGGSGSNVMQAGGVTAPPGAGLGATGPRGTTGQNTSSGGTSNFGNNNYQQYPPGAPGVIGTPTLPGTGPVQPAGGVGMGPSSDRGAPSSAAYAPPEPVLPPPPPPGHSSAAGSDFGGAALPVQPPPTLAPLAPPPPSGGSTKGTGGASVFPGQ
jgi:hypothetical protein